jgi:branched-chain amino acid transport system ATP-binding protein
VFVVVANQLLINLQTQSVLVYGGAMMAILLWSPGGLTEVPRALIRRRARDHDLVMTLASQRLEVPPSEFNALTAPQDGEIASDEGRAPSLTVNGLCVTLGGLEVVRDVSFAVRSGEILGLIGPNGAGKSTILNAVSGMVRASAGSVLLGDVEIVGRAPNQIRTLGISRTLQTPHVYDDMNVWENIAVGLDFALKTSVLAAGLTLPRSRRTEREIRDRAMRMADAVGLGRLATRRVDELSGGQRRLVDLARAVVSGAPVLLLDEPMAGLSPAMADAVQEIVVTLAAAGRAVVLVEHNFDHIEAMATEGIFLLQGAVAFRGPIESVLMHEQVIAEYTGVA